MNFIESIKKLFFPEGIVCIGCGSEMEIPSEYGICNECSVTKNTRFCKICGRGLVGEGDYCDDCKYDKRYFDEARAPVLYENLSKSLVQKYKIGNKKYLSKYLARFMYDSFSETDWEVDFMTFVPISKANFKARGFNQAELLARDLSEMTKIKVKDIIRKITDKGDSAKMGRKERAANITNTLEVVDKLHGERILLIDDILTTGYTAEECSKVLKKAGASKVYVLTFATSVCKPVMY